MGFITGTASLLAKGVWGTAKAASDVLFNRGAIARTLVGGAIGAIGGYNSESELGNSNLNARNALQWGAVGALGGLGLGLGHEAARFAVKSATKRGNFTKTGDWLASQAVRMPDRLYNLGIGGVKKGYGLGKSVANAGLWAMNHPFVAGGIGGAAYLGATGVANKFNHPFTSPSLSGATVSTNYDQQAIAAENGNRFVSPAGQTGSLPSMMGPITRGFQNSTDGLVQGLHRGRHS
jgi:hypothetical protein